jgi:hypothetical protein
MSILKRWNGSSWVTVPDGSSVKYWGGSNWVIPNAVKYWNGSSWQTAWTKSNPITLTFIPSVTTSLRWDGNSTEWDHPATSNNGAKADMFLGRYGGSAPYHFTSLMKFDAQSEENQGTLQQAMTARPVVKNASIRLNRVESGLNSPAGYLRIGTFDQQNIQTLPSTTVDGSRHDWPGHTATSVTGWSFGENKTFPVAAKTINGLDAGKALMFAEVMSDYKNSGGTTSAYMMIYGVRGSNSGLVPKLTVTLDVV